MSRLGLLRCVALCGLLVTAACDKGATAPADAAPTAVPPVAAIAPAKPATSTTSMNPLLGREPVKEAIYRALKTGQNQRWQDGDLSGYAVPSLDTLPNGCRTVRYTVDQRPDDPAMTINACDGSN